MASYDEALQRYPDWAWAFNIPEVGDKIRQALNDPGYASSRLQSEIMQTNWYKTTQASAREWEALVQRDPESANARRRQREADVYDAIIKAGMGPNPQLAQELAQQALRLGWNDAQLNDAIVGRINYDARNRAVGSVGAAQDSIKKLAARYMIPISDETAFNYGKAIAAGEQTAEGFEVGFRDQAKGRFPTLAKYIDQGTTPADFFSPYQERIGQLLERPPSQINLLNDTRWNAVLDKVDEKTGERRPMTLNEVDVFARRQDEFRQTRNGQQAAADAADGILRMFGKVAS